MGIKKMEIKSMNRQKISNLTIRPHKNMNKIEIEFRKFLIHRATKLK